jgi:hypothetical protein
MILEIQEEKTGQQLQGAQQPKPRAAPSQKTAVSRLPKGTPPGIRPFPKSRSGALKCPTPASLPQTSTFCARPLTQRTRAHTAGRGQHANPTAGQTPGNRFQTQRIAVSQG